MNVKVVYHSVTGKTKKIAEAIAEVAGVSAEPLGQTAPAFGGAAIDLLFLGAARHKGQIDGSVASFVASLDPKKVKRVAVFVTGMNEEAAVSSHRVIGSMIEGRRLKVETASFTCRGQFLFFNRGRPNADDVAKAKEFAKKMIG